MLYKLAAASAIVASAHAFTPASAARPAARAGRASAVSMAADTATKREIDLAQYRNFGIMAHIDAGKTCARAAFGVHSRVRRARRAVFPRARSREPCV